MAVLALVVTLLPTLIYCKAITADFVFDDYAIIVNEQRIETLSGALRFFYEPYLLATPQGEGFESQVLYYYRPLPGLMHALEYRFFGEDPLPYKVVHLFLVCALSLVSFLVLAGLTQNLRLSFFAALLFNLNPCRAEIGYWIYSDTHVFAAIFSLLCLHTFAKGRYGIFFICYLLALTSQEIAVMIPFALLAYHYLVARSERGGRVLCGALLVLPLYLALRYNAVGSQFGLRIDFLEFVNTTIVVAAKYLKVLFVPDAPVTAYMFVKGEFSGFTGAVICAYAVVLGVSVLVVWLARKRYRYFFWVLWALVFMLPAFNVGGLGQYLLAEKAWNIASLGVFVVLADAAGRLGLYAPHLGYVALLLLSFYWGVTVVQRGDYWQNTQIYLQKAIEFEPRFIMLRDFLYQYDVFIEDFAHAEESLNAWNRYAPRNSQLRKRYGELYYRLGFANNSEAYYEKSIEYDPEQTESYNNLGKLYLDRGDLEKAAAHFERAVQKDGSNYAALFNMGTVKERQGACAEAVDYFRRAAQVNVKLRQQVAAKVWALQHRPEGCR